MSPRWVLTGLLVLGLTACSRSTPAPPPPPSSATPTAVPAYDASLPPARAVLTLVPDAATTVELTDVAVIRRDVGLPELTSHSSPADRAAFSARAGHQSALLTTGLLRPVDARLRASYGFGADDVAWEAHFSGGGTRGWVIAFRDGVDMRGVARAAADGIGALGRAQVDEADHLVTSGVSPSPAVWSQDDGWAALVPAEGEAFVLRRGCVPPRRLAGPRRLTAAALAGVPTGVLRPLAASALTLGDHVATVRMSRNRLDLFDRMTLARHWPTAGGGRWGRVFENAVGDPSSGRIGFDVPRPPRAVALLRRRILPYAVCPPPA